MMVNNALAQQFVTEICGREYEFSRSLGLLRRIEQAVGPALPFAQKLERRELTQEQIARFYVALLRGTERPPLASEVDAWVFARGSAHGEMAMFVGSLTMGSEELERVLARLSKAAQPNGEDARGPFVPTARPTGAT